MNKVYLKYLFLLCFGLFHLTGCSVKKYIPEGEMLFQGGEVKVIDTAEIENKSGLENELQSLLYPEPNTKFLGLYPGLHYYYKAQTDKSNFITRFLNKKIGEKPAYFSDVKLEDTENLIDNRLENNGFFYSSTTSTIEKDTVKKTVKTNYTVRVSKPYRLKSYQLEVDSLDALGDIPVYREISKSLKETILKEGNRYNLDAFKAERERIDQYLKKKGYYNFNSNFILFQADTNLSENRKYNLYLKLKPGVPEKSKVPYVLNKIEVNPNTTKDTSDQMRNMEIIEGISFKQNEIFFKPKRLNPFILLRPGQFYDPVKSKYSSQRLSSIGTYKFVNIDYEEIESNIMDSVVPDSIHTRYLNATISLSPLTKRSIRAELQAVTKSNDFTGPNLSLTYLNRNIFKGGENFSASGNIGYEKQFGRKTNGSSSLRLGVSMSLTYPRLIFPGNLGRHFKYSIPKTKITTGFDYFRRSNLYNLNSYSGSFGYVWNASNKVIHQFNPIQIDYVKLGQTSAQFDSTLNANPFLKRSFEQQFIAGLTYSYTFNELDKTNKKGEFYLRFNYDMAGNTIDLLGKTREGDSAKSLLGLQYAQYVKGDLDLSYHYSINNSEHTIVGRVFGGIGIPYGNSETLPFVKQYFSGGSYSVRAFQIRGLGPGEYQPDENVDSYFDRSGDIRLEGNLEYRFPLISVLKGAIFADAGNIWNLTDNLEGGKFTSDFYKQFGVGAGIGLRVDVQGFVIRFDFAAPLKRPSTTWDFDYKNPVFNFAIGYPF